MSTTLCPSCQTPVGEEVGRCPTCGLAFAPRLVSPAPVLIVPAGGAPSSPRPGVPLLSSPPPGASARPDGRRETGRGRGTPPGLDPYLGSIVAGRFRVDALIGQGGMGRVYKATHLGLDKTVCLKTLRPALVGDETVVGRFEREAKAASRLDHPNSIQVLDFGQDERGNLFLVMEYVAGRDLRRLLREEFPLPEARVVRIVAQVLAALSRAHAEGVIHRDLKPENILVCDKPEEPDFVKVLDFGIAKILGPDSPLVTKGDLICGTPEYMSPEQAMGRPLDARSDLYAVGVVLYQAFAGFLPFDGENGMEVLHKHVSERPRPPHEVLLSATCSDAMEALILRSLEKDPARRPQTAEEFRRELLELAGLSTTPPGARPPSKPPSAPSPLAKAPAGAADEVPTAPDHPPARSMEPTDAPALLHRPAPTDDFDAALHLPRSHAPIYVSLVVAALALVVAAVALFRPAEHHSDADLLQEPLKNPAAGGLTQTQAYQIIESHQHLVEHCFHLAARSIRGQSGEIVLSIAIGPDGRVQEANIPSSTAEVPRIERCVVAHAKTWTFPPPQRPPMMLSYTYRYHG